jgi:predicted permease
MLTRTAALLATLPTGTGPFMLAEFYAREAAVRSRVILVSTIISILALPAYLAVSA